MAAADDQKLPRRCFKAGAGLFLFVFLGHTAGQLMTDFATPTPERARVYEQMASTTGMDGSAHSLHDFYRGNSYGMGFLMLAIGLLLLQVAGSFERRGLTTPRSLCAFGAVTAWAMVLLSIAFFPAIPIVVLTASGVLFTLAAARTREH